VLSLIRFDALPVGAHNKTFFLFCSKRLKIHLRIVVLPVPGPPVIIETPFFKAEFIASIWSKFKLILLSCW